MKIYCDSSIKEGCIVIEGKSPYIFLHKGKQTNNSGEYEAVIFALKIAISSGIEQAEILTDSQLVVEQVASRWACRQPHLQRLRQRVWELLAQNPKISIKWVPREENLAGKALEHRGSL